MLTSPGSPHHLWHHLRFPTSLSGQTSPGPWLTAAGGGGRRLTDRVVLTRADTTAVTVAVTVVARHPASAQDTPHDTDGAPGTRLEENDGKLTRGLLELPSSVSSSSRTIFTHWALIAPPPQAPQSQGLETCSEYLSSPLLAQLCPYTRLFEGWLFPSQQALRGLPSNADAGGCPPSPQAADLTIPLFHSSPSWCQATNRPFLHLRDDSGQAQDKGDAADSKSCGAEKWNGKEPMPQSLKGMDFAVRLI